jgi:hypothetical protein
LIQAQYGVQVRQRCYPKWSECRRTAWEHRAECSGVYRSSSAGLGEAFTAHSQRVHSRSEQAHNQPTGASLPRECRSAILLGGPQPRRRRETGGAQRSTRGGNGMVGDVGQLAAQASIVEYHPESATNSCGVTGGPKMAIAQHAARTGLGLRLMLLRLGRVRLTDWMETIDSPTRPAPWARCSTSDCSPNTCQRRVTTAPPQYSVVSIGQLQPRRVWFAARTTRSADSAGPAP